MNKAILVAQFLRDRAWWRLDSAGASAPRVARSVVSLLDAADRTRLARQPQLAARRASRQTG